MTKKYTIVLLAGMIICSLCSCGFTRMTYDVKDVTRPETITLRNAPGGGPVYSLSIVGQGELEGNATITLVLNGEPYKRERLSGKVQFRWDGDWYSDEAKIIYEPSAVRAGRLSLKYAFNH
jgi:hypothetical protein